MPDRDAAIEFYRRLNAYVLRGEIHGAPVLGIQLRNCPVSDDDLKPLAAIRDELRVVGLDGTQITDDGLRLLRDLPQLDNVDLTNTAITDSGLDILSTIQTLEYIHVVGTRVTPDGIAKLQHALPECEIVWDEP